MRSFFGSLTYYSRFIPNLQQQCQPLHRLLQKGTKWVWTSADQKLFESLKSQITSDSVLVHYNPELPLFLSTDASGYGIGALLQHRTPDGVLKPIAAVSRVLTKAEKNYSALDREALAIIFGVEKFYRYLAARPFTIITDHKPLQHIFGEKSELPKMAATRLVRWAVILSGYRYSIEYRPSCQNAVPDCLSRLPIKSTDSSTVQSDDGAAHQIFSLTLQNCALTPRIVEKRTLEDSVLSQIVRFQKSGWPEKRNIPESIKPYFEKRDALSLRSNILLWHDRIVVPASLQQRILNKLHEGHAGIVATKSLARLTVWWPNIDKCIERLVNACSACQSQQPKEPETPLHLWNLPAKPWDRVHIDFTGPMDGLQWLVIIDAYSRWLEVFPMASATSANVIKVLRTLIARYGVCKSIVSDNGTPFTSNEFVQFCQNNGIKNITSTPYHSRTNGLVERAIRTFKWRYHKCATTLPDRDHRLQTLLFQYRNTEHSVTGTSPAELFLGRRLTTNLYRLKPDPELSHDSKSFKSKVYHDQHSKQREFASDAPVWYRRAPDAEWHPGTVKVRNGPLSYEVADANGTMRRMHADHLRTRVDSPVSTPSASNQSGDDQPGSDQNQPESSQAVESSALPDSAPTPRRSGRVRHPPTRLNLHLSKR